MLFAPPGRRASRHRHYLFNQRSSYFRCRAACPCAPSFRGSPRHSCCGLIASFPGPCASSGGRLPEALFMVFQFDSRGVKAIYLQNLASVQPRPGLSKFAKSSKRIEKTWKNMQRISGVYIMAKFQYPINISPPSGEYHLGTYLYILTVSSSTAGFTDHAGLTNFFFSVQLNRKEKTWKLCFDFWRSYHQQEHLHQWLFGWFALVSEVSRVFQVCHVNRLPTISSSRDISENIDSRNFGPIL